MVQETAKEAVTELQHGGVQSAIVQSRDVVEDRANAQCNTSGKSVWQLPRTCQLWFFTQQEGCALPWMFTQPLSCTPL